MTAMFPTSIFKPGPVRPHARFMTPGDHPAVLEIEAASFDPAWDGVALRKALGRPETIGMVAECPWEGVVGYVVYRIGRDYLRVERLAAAPTLRRRKVGTALINVLKHKSAQQARRRLLIDVDERMAPVFAFLGSCGFRATGVVRGVCRDGADAYAFRYALPDHGFVGPTPPEEGWKESSWG